MTLSIERNSDKSVYCAYRLKPLAPNQIVKDSSCQFTINKLISVNLHNNKHKENSL